MAHLFHKYQVKPPIEFGKMQHLRQVAMPEKPDLHAAILLHDRCVYLYEHIDTCNIHFRHRCHVDDDMDVPIVYQQEGLLFYLYGMPGSKTARYGEDPWDGM